MRMWLMFSGVQVPSRYQHRSYMPVVGAGLRQRGRGRMRAPRVLESVAVEWCRCGIQVVLLVKVGVRGGSKMRGGVHW